MIQEVLLKVFLVELDQVLWPFNNRVNLVVSCVLNYNSVIKVKIIVEAKHVHGSIVDLVGLLRVVLQEYVVLILNKVLVLLVVESSVTVFFVTSVAIASNTFTVVYNISCIFFNFILKLILEFLCLDCFVVLNVSLLILLVEILAVLLYSLSYLSRLVCCCNGVPLHFSVSSQDSHMEDALSSYSFHVHYCLSII